MNLNLKSDFFLYSLCFLCGLQIKIFQGFYLYTIALLMYAFVALCCGVKIKKFSERLLFTLICVSLSLISLFIQATQNIDISSFYIFFDVVIFWSSYLALSFVNISSRFRYSLILFFISLPLWLSILMYLSPLFNSYLLQLYNVEPYSGLWRFGGIYGADVNTLGFYSTLVLFLTLFLTHLNKITKKLSCLFCVISVITILLSGMRAGLIVLFLLIILFSLFSKFKIIRLRKIFLILTVSIILIIFINEFLLDNLYWQYLMKRFSFSHLLNDFNADGNSDLAGAIAYWYSFVQYQNLDFSKILFGVNSTFNYVDDVYLFLFLKYGIILVLFLIAYFIFIIYRCFKSSNHFAAFLLLFAAIIGVKGIFPLNGAFFFIFLLIYKIWVEDQKFNPPDPPAAS